MAAQYNMLDEMSKRIDSNQNDILILRERTHNIQETQGVIVGAVEKLSDQIISVFEKQDQLSKKIIDSVKENNEKFKQFESPISKINIVTNNWKTILWIIIISTVIGFSFESGIKDFIKVVAVKSVSKVVD